METLCFRKSENLSKKFRFYQEFNIFSIIDGNPELKALNLKLATCVIMVSFHSEYAFLILTMEA